MQKFETTRQDPEAEAGPLIVEVDCLQEAWVPHLIALRDETETTLAAATPFDVWVRKKGDAEWVKYICKPILDWVGERVVPEEE